MSSKVKIAYDRYRTVFENHKNLLSFTATALSCMAAYLGYLQRMRHQQKLEEQLRELNQTISHEQQIRASDISNFGKKTSDVSMIALFMASSALLGYSVGRFHGRRSAIKRFVSLTNPPPTAATAPAQSAFGKSVNPLVAMESTVGATSEGSTVGMMMTNASDTTTNNLTNDSTVSDSSPEFTTTFNSTSTTPTTTVGDDNSSSFFDRFTSGESTSSTTSGSNRELSNSDGGEEQKDTDNNAGGSCSGQSSEKTSLLSRFWNK